MIIMPSANKTVQNKTPLFWQMRTHVWVWVFMASNIILKSPCKGYFFLFLCSTINKGAIWMFHHVSFLPGWVIFAPKAPGPFLAAGSCKTYLWVGRVWAWARSTPRLSSHWLCCSLSLSHTHTHTHTHTQNTFAIIGQFPPPVLGIATETKSSEHKWLGLANTII